MKFIIRGNVTKNQNIELILTLFHVIAWICIIKSSKNVKLNHVSGNICQIGSDKI